MGGLTISERFQVVPNLAQGGIDAQRGRGHPARKYIEIPSHRVRITFPMEPPTARRAADALALCILAIMAAALLVRLPAFPGLHGDEAWVGLFALRMRLRGLYTPHLMNTYTGALYAWVVKCFFDVFGVSVGSLRLPGALLNVAAWLVIWRAAARAGGAKAGLVWCALAASSAIVVLKSRVAWEVYALQPLLLGLVVSAALRLVEGGKRAPAFLLFSASLLGVQNHFIFLSLPLALAAASAALYARGREGRWLDLLQAGLVNLGPCLILFFIKPVISEASWPALKFPLLALFALLPFAALAAFETAPRWRGALAGFFAHPRAAAAAPWVRKGFFILLAVAFWFHWVALIQIQSGVSVLARLASWRLPAALDAFLYIGAAALLAGTLGAGLARLRDGGGDEAPGAALLLVLPVVYAAVFVLFRNTSAIRYYILPSHLILLAASSAWLRLSPPRRMPVLAAAAAGGLVLHGLFWAAPFGPSDRPPFLFRVGWHLDKSHDFISKDALFGQAEREGVCRVINDESMLDIPLFFDISAHPRSCVPGKAIAASYCWDCASPPYIKTRLVPE